MIRINLCHMSLGTLVDMSIYQCKKRMWQCQEWFAWFSVLNKIFNFMQLVLERHSQFIFDWAIFMRLCICEASESLNTFPLTPLKSLGVGLCGGTNEWPEVRTPTPSQGWRWSLLLTVAKHLFTAGVWPLIVFFFFLLQLLWTWTILWLTWRLFKHSTRMWVIEETLIICYTHNCVTVHICTRYFNKEIWFGRTEFM